MQAVASLTWYPVCCCCAGMRLVIPTGTLESSVSKTIKNGTSETKSSHLLGTLATHKEGATVGRGRGLLKDACYVGCSCCVCCCGECITLTADRCPSHPHYRSQQRAVSLRVTGFSQPTFCASCNAFSSKHARVHSARECKAFPAPQQASRGLGAFSSVPSSG